MPPSIAKCATERLDAGVAQIGVLDAGHRSAREKSDRRAAGARCCAGASGAGKAVRRAAEIVDQRVIPVAEEFSDHADARAAEVFAVVEFLRIGRRRIGMVVVTADVPHACGW